MIQSLLRERRRRLAIERLGILHTPPEVELAGIVEHAAVAFAAPMALLTLLHEKTMWVKASTGVDLTCLPRKQSFCNHAVDDGNILQVCDVLADEQFRHLPSVTGAPHIRYYIGKALTLINGTSVGVLCVLDTVARPPASPDQQAYLAGLARQAAASLDRLEHINGGAAA